MNKKFYISDLHIGHENVIKFDDRPFKNLEEMHEEIIKRWNSVVDDGDITYLCGDILWNNSCINIIQSLKGQKHLILGNHDRINDDIKKCFVSISDYKKVKDGDKTVVLSHFPIVAYDGSFRGRNIHLYGHVHTTREDSFVQDYISRNKCDDYPMLMYNVGCMMPWMNYFPRTLDEILKGANNGE